MREATIQSENAVRRLDVLHNPAVADAWVNALVIELPIHDPADNARVKIAEECADNLANYPILDETDYSEREWNATMEYWAHRSVQERVEWLQRAKQCIFAARHTKFPPDNNGYLYELLTRC